MVEKAKAQIDAHNGKAIVYDVGKIWLFDILKKGPQAGSGKDSTLFLPPDTPGVEMREAGDHPYADLERYIIRVATRRHLAISCMLFVLEPATGVLARYNTAQLVEMFLADDEVEIWVRKACMEMPASEKYKLALWPIEKGRVHQLVLDMAAKWQPPATKAG